MTPPREWERQPDETAPAYAALRCYLDQGPARSVTKVAEELDKSRSLIGRWSSRHRWRPRADAWDAHLTTTYVAEARDARRTLAHRHLAISHAALEKVAAAVTALAGDGLTVAELVKLWDIATRTERDALQLPGRVEISGPGGGPVVVDAMTDEERLTRLLALRREVDARIGDRIDPDNPDDLLDPDTDEEPQP